MGSLWGPVPTCSPDKICVEWVHKYMKDCICSWKDELSFALGLISVICWGVAEIPQILTNFKEKTTEGVSLAFLATWVLGDIFNLAGCYLEPSTLPTQFLTALLYTVTTLILVFQVVYYDHILKWRKEKALSAKPEPEEVKFEDVTARRHGQVPISSKPISAIPSLQQRTPGRDLYIMSARSLASSHTPTAGSYLVGSRGSLLHHPPSLGEPSQLARLGNSYSSPIHSAAVLRAVVTSALCLFGFNMHSHFLARPIVPTLSLELNSKFFVANNGRKLLEEQDIGLYSALSEGGGGSDLGFYLGWLMAAIYMGGRLPQIWLNIKRGTVEGLNPLMFMFAVLGNATYVGSILVRNIQWKTIKYNMPWLVDAAVCVILDIFIICQFIYYSLTRRSRDYENECGEYKLLK